MVFFLTTYFSRKTCIQSAHVEPKLHTRTSIFFTYLDTYLHFTILLCKWTKYFTYLLTDFQCRASSSCSWWLCLSSWCPGSWRGCSSGTAAGRRWIWRVSARIPTSFHNFRSFHKILNIIMGWIILWFNKMFVVYINITVIKWLCNQEKICKEWLKKSECLLILTLPCEVKFWAH